MQSPWSEIVMGSVSLFPLFGELGKLKGFFPQKSKHLFITFATIFSFIIFLFIQKYFDKFEFMPFYISPFLTVFIGFLCLLIYILLQFSINPRYGSLSRLAKSFFMVFSFVLFVALVASLTFSFNYIEQMGKFTIIKGSVSIPNQVPIVEPVRIELTNSEGVSIRPHFTKKNGQFRLYFKNEIFQRIGSIRFSTQISGKNYASTTQQKNIPENEWPVMLLEIRR